MTTTQAHFPPFCGNPVSTEQQRLIADIINRYQGLSRTELASTLCELLGWVRPNGKLKTVECRQYLEQLDQKTLLQLPEKRQQAKRRTSRIVLSNNIEPGDPLHGALKDFRPISLDLVQGDAERSHWKTLVERHHYLGYRMPFGAHLRYFIRAQRPAPAILGCLQFSSPAWRMAPRDQWIGWSDTGRAKHLQHIINNSRFLVLPHVRIPNLASHVLSLAAHQVTGDWQARFHVEPVLIETLVDQARFHGGCYRAANWIDAGVTSGRGRQDRAHQRHDAAPKRIFLYPLHPRAQQRLCQPA